MADEDDRDTADVTSDSSAEDASELETELMVSTRERRKTAGNRYSTTIGQEQEAADEEDDDVALLFAEGEEGEDEEYNSYEGDEDADMSSSDDNDDQGPNAAADDLEGEKELEKQAKAERQRKRKADLALTTMAAIKKKKPKIDPTSLHRAPDKPKPSKRKERVSWLPEHDSAPGRTSLRKQTIAHREVTHARLKENEKQRLKLKAVRERKERERQAEAPKELTQEDRLAEAARVERRNAKSLNRWEAMEKKRQEEQAAKLAALKDRKLEGAVITLYSSAHTYRGHKLERTSPGPLANGGIHEPKKRGRKPKALLEQLAAAKQSQVGQVSSNSSFRDSGTAVAIATGTEQTQTTSGIHPSIDPLTTSHESSNVMPNSTEEDALVKSRPDTEMIEPDDNAELIPSSERHEKGSQEQKHEHLSNQPPKEVQDDTTGQSEPSIEKNSQHTPQDQEPDAAQSETDDPLIDIIPDKSPERLQEEQKDQNQDRSAEALQEESQSQSQSKIDEIQSAHEDTPSRPEPEDITPSESTDRPTDVTEIKNEGTEQQMTDSSSNEVLPENSLENLQSRGLANQESQEPKQEINEPQAVPEVHQETPSQTGDLQTYSSNEQSSLQIDPTVLPTSNLETTPGTPLVEVISTRNLVILEKFEQLSSSSRQDFNVFYGTRKSGRPSKQTAEVCPVTGLPAKYKDPATGLGYANAAAYKKLKDLRHQQFTWSGMLGCYVGREGTAARGVPDGFLG